MLFMATPKAQTCNLALSGHIHDNQTHKNLVGATIILLENKATTISNLNGDFLFKDLCAGNYTIKVYYTGYDSLVLKIELEKDKHIDADLISVNSTLSTVTVTANKAMKKTGFEKQLAGRELEQTRGKNISEALAQINGVRLLQTGSNIAKPIVHGLHSSRIIMMNNGVRQEGQQWGSEHAPEIDPFMAGSLVLIKGVDELKYGSDAIGAVILVQPIKLPVKPGYDASLQSIYFTNNQQYSLAAQFEQQPKKLKGFAYRLQGSYKKAANTNTPLYSLNNTANNEKNFSLTAGWQKEHFNTEWYYSFFDTELGIFTGSHIGNLSDLQNAIAAERPSPVFTGQNSYKIGRPYQSVRHQLFKIKTVKKINDHIFTLQFATQYNQRSEFDIVRNAQNKNPQVSLSLLSLNESLQWQQPKQQFFNASAGIEFKQQDNSYSGRYLIPNYKLYAYGAYFIEKFEKSKWQLQTGLRYDKKNIKTTRLLSNGATYNNYDFNFSTLAASFSADYKWNNNLKLNALLSIASRAPEVNELLTNAVHHGNGTFEQGNIYLKPEKSFNVIANAVYQNTAGWLKAELNLYNNRINDFIYEQPKPDEPVLTISGAFPKVAYQATNASLTGADFNTDINLSKPLSVSFKYSGLRAKNRSINDWLIGMPADKLSTEFSYQFKDVKTFLKPYVSAGVAHVLKQTRTPNEDLVKQDYKDAPPAYTLVYANASAQFLLFKYPVTLNVSGKNLLNIRYRDYTNSFRYFTDEMGRNISVGLDIKLKK